MTNEKRSYSRKVVDIDFSFAPDTADPPTDLRGKGVASVEYISTGLFRATLKDVWVGLLAAHASLQLAAGADVVAQIGAVDLDAKTVDIRLWDFSAGAVANVAANANNRVNVSLTLTSTTHYGA